MNSKLLTLVGSRGRDQQTSKSDYDYITTNMPAVKEMFEKKKNLKKLKWGDKIISVKLGDKKIDVFSVGDKVIGKISYTLPKGEIIGLRKLAKSKGMILNNDGLFKKGKKINVTSLTDLKNKLGTKSTIK